MLNSPNRRFPARAVEARARALDLACPPALGTLLKEAWCVKPQLRAAAQIVTRALGDARRGEVRRRAMIPGPARARYELLAAIATEREAAMERFAPRRAHKLNAVFP